MIKPFGTLKNLVPQRLKNIFHLLQAYISLVWFRFPSKKLKVIGVTGTKGKTTTCFIIHHILSRLGIKVGLVTSIGAKIGTRSYNTGFHVTNPDSFKLNWFLRKMVEEKCEYAILEVSSHGIDQNRIAGINFEIGVLTNIAPEHLDYHKTFDEYKRVKMSFIDSCKMKVISPKNTKLKVLDGDFNNLNVEAALMALERLGFDKLKCLSELKSFKLPEGRMMYVANKLGITICVDFAHTPDSLKAILSHFKTIKKRKLICVFGCAGERDPNKRAVMGGVSAEIADYSIFTAEDPRSEDVNEIIGEIARGAEKHGAVESKINNSEQKINSYFRIPERGEAITFAIQTLAKKGDIVLICGKGHEKSMAYRGVEYPWDDRKAVELALKKKVFVINRL